MTPIKGLIAIGSSTGGPRALQHILSQLPADFPAAILVVQHMPHAFTRAFAQRLDGLSALHVVEANNRDPVRAGTVYVAPGNQHMAVRQRGEQLQIVLDDSEVVSGHRPSVDYLFSSLRGVENMAKALLILTGMGKDGAHGLQQVKEADPAVITMAEDEASCVVFGMPRAAIATGCVDHILPLASIAGSLQRIVNHWETGGG